jgi:hypothetical protein
MRVIDRFSIKASLIIKFAVKVVDPIVNIAGHIVGAIWRCTFMGLKAVMNISIIIPYRR